MAKNKRLGTDFEKKIVAQAKQAGVSASLQPLSGQLSDFPGDIEFNEFLGECKVRAAKIDASGSRFIHLDSEWLEKINKQAEMKGKRFGVLFVKMKHSSSSYTVVRTEDFLELVKKACIKKTLML